MSTNSNDLQWQKFILSAFQGLKFKSRYLQGHSLVVVVIQWLSHVWLFATPWTTARQASLSITNSWSLLKLMSIESVMPSSHLILCHPLLFLYSISPSIKVFSSESVLRISWPKYSTGASDSASVLPMNIQCWFPLGLTGLISLLSKGFSRVFSSTTVRKHHFFGAQPSLWSYSHLCAWLLEKLWLWLCRPLSAKWCFCFFIHCLGFS